MGDRYMRCPQCNEKLARLMASHEPEGIRKDVYCAECDQHYAVTKAGYIRL